MDRPYVCGPSHNHSLITVASYVAYILAKIVKERSSFTPRFDSLQNIEIALLTAPLVVICVQLQDVCLLPGFQSCVYILKIGFNLSHLSGLYNFLTFDIKYNILEMD